MNVGLPVLISEICGGSLGLIKDNRSRFKFNSSNIKDISRKINKGYNFNINNISISSMKIIEKLFFNNLKKKLERRINKEKSL